MTPEMIEGAGIVLFVLAFAPALIAGFAPGRLLLALVVFALNAAALAGLFLFVVPGVIIWFAALFLAVSVYNGAKRDKHERRVLRVLEQAAATNPSLALAQAAGPPLVEQQPLRLPPPSAFVWGPLPSLWLFICAAVIVGLIVVAN